MKHTELSDGFVQLLDQQSELIEQMAGHETELQEAVGERDWQRLESLMQRMSQLSDAIVAVERRRNEVYTALAMEFGGEATFARVLTMLPVEERQRLSAAYRRLKVAVLGLQSRTAGMDAYLRATMSTTRGVLQELYPEQTSRGYSRDGQGQFNTASAVMVDRAL